MTLKGDRKMLFQMTTSTIPFCKSFHVPVGQWRRRLFYDEVAVGFGLARPANVSELCEHDFLNVGQLMLISHHGKIILKTAAALIRANWKESAAATAIAERTTPSSYSKHQAFVIGTDDKKTRFAVEIGPFDQAAAALAKRDPGFFHVLLDRVRKGAIEAGIVLPQYFFPGLPSSPAFRGWLAEAEELRGRALRGGTALGPGE